MFQKRAGDIMISVSEYPHVRHTDTIRHAVEVMEHAHLEVARRRSLPRALLVFDDEDHALGIVRRRDIFRGLEPKFLKTVSVPRRKQLIEIEIDPELFDLSTDRVGKAIQEQAELPVSEIMQPFAATVDYDDHLSNVIYKMLSRNLSLIPVVKEKRVVGVVRTVDVFQEVAALLTK
ncbi:MAG: CBS domain-containing protein [Candidatus Zixiibacteriota bacterium]|nr:MAG: CBS domain-containing protein [candidate division Zixibacteria bacterium]